MYIAIGSIVIIGAILGVYFFLANRPVGPATPKSKTPEQKDTEHIQRLSYLMKIVLEHSSSTRQESSIREVVRIGESISDEGGFRYMVKIHEAVTQSTSPKVGVKLKALWKGIGEWRG